MAGLLNANRKDDDVESNVTPEEQAEYDRFVTNGMNVLYDDKALPAIVESLQGDGNPVEGLANTLVMLVMRLEDSAEQAGQKISGDVMMHGGAELMEQLVEVAEQAKVHTFKDEEIESALFLAMDNYRTTRQQQGKLPEEQLQSDMQELMRAEQAGTLDEILPPGIEKYANRAQEA